MSQMSFDLTHRLSLDYEDRKAYNDTPKAQEIIKEASSAIMMIGKEIDICFLQNTSAMTTYNNLQTDSHRSSQSIHESERNSRHDIDSFLLDGSQRRTVR